MLGLDGDSKYNKKLHRNTNQFIKLLFNKTNQYVIFLILLLIITYTLFTNYSSDVTLSPSSGVAIQLSDRLPLEYIGYAILTVGRKNDYTSLNNLIEQLLSSGVHRYDIFVFEDDGLSGYSVDTQISEIVNKHKIRLKHSHLLYQQSIDDVNAMNNHTAQQYRYVLDTLLMPHMNDIVNGREVTTHGYDFGVILQDTDSLIYTNKNNQHQLALPYYMYYMSRLMASDDSIYCVSAVDDNSFKASELSDPIALPLRRTHQFLNHAFMISAAVYQHRLRPYWMDVDGKLYHTHQLYNNLDISNWSIYMQSQIQMSGTANCIYTAQPLVNTKENGVRLASEQYKLSLIDIQQMHQQSYHMQLQNFIRICTVVTDVQSIKLYRDSSICMFAPIEHDSDTLWHELVQAQLGYTSIVHTVQLTKQLNIYHGTTIVDYLSNTVLIIAKYSRYASEVVEQHKFSVRTHPSLVGLLSPALYSDNQQVNLVHSHQNNVVEVNGMMNDMYIGCHIDALDKRDLPHLLAELSPHLSAFKDTIYQFALSPPSLHALRCIAACSMLSFKYAAVQHGSECYCGNTYGQYGTVLSEKCNVPCSINTHAQSVEAIPLAMIFKQPCGGPLTNSVYKTMIDSKQYPPTQSAWLSSSNAIKLDSFNQDAQMVAALLGQSCDEACKGEGLICREYLVPLLSNECDAMKQLTKCNTCVNSGDASFGAFSPSIDTQTHICVLSAAKYADCSTVPPKHIKRACVCKSQN